MTQRRWVIPQQLYACQRTDRQETEPQALNHMELRFVRWSINVKLQQSLHKRTVLLVTIRRISAADSVEGPVAQRLEQGTHNHLATHRSLWVLGGI
jgi:hypothetical protein